MGKMTILPLFLIGILISCQDSDKISPPGKIELKDGKPADENTGGQSQDAQKKPDSDDDETSEDPVESSSDTVNGNGKPGSNLPCSPGYYCPEGTKSPLGAGMCRKGYYCPEDSEKPTGAGRCQAGYYCPEGSSTKTEYPSGKGYYTTSGAFEKTDCGIGFYCPDEANEVASACQNLPANAEYSDLNAQTENCAFRCNSGYVKDGRKCVRPADVTGNTPPVAYKADCIVYAKPLTQGSCQVSCPSGKIKAQSATPLKNYASQCRYSGGTCYSYNNASVGLSTASSVCRCDITCE